MVNIKLYQIKQRKNIKRVENNENRSMNTYKRNEFEQNNMTKERTIKIVKKIRKCIQKNRR